MSLKDWLDRSGKGVRWLARWSGVTRPTIYRALKGQRITYAKALAISEATDWQVPTIHLVAGSET